jgi:hypothetical protein
VGVHIVDAPQFAELAAAEAEAGDVAREVRATAGASTRVEVVVMKRPANGAGWQRRSFWFEGEAP